ncbi:putative syntaxin 8 [Paratrimastix pyriformis]|uniref:Syntaxin 8 n=1 Tax=Paratrimastix pyriformis TaxID=342808 RepID=A0ABQ8UJ22_9EUKA|nr:putative syntaxin 8 [Paratrimastix pyriformis]
MAIDEDPEAALPYISMGVFLCRRRLDLGGATANFRRALELDPKDGHAAKKELDLVMERRRLWESLPPGIYCGVRLPNTDPCDVQHDAASPQNKKLARGKKPTSPKAFFYILMNPDEWRAFYEQGNTDLQALQADVNKKVELLRGGASGVGITKMHAAINSGVAAMKRRVSELESALRVLSTRSDIISFKDVQALENKLKKLRDGYLDVARKNALTTAELTANEKQRLIDRPRPRMGEPGWEPPKETTETRAMNDDAMLAHMHAEMHSQDQALGALSTSVQRSHEMAVQIGDEVDLQSHLLAQVTKKVDRTNAQVKAVDKKIVKLSKSRRSACG